MNATTIDSDAPVSLASDGAARRDSRLGAGLAALAGLLIVWAIGFAPLTSLHNAAHDTRHSNGLPCH